MSIGSAIAIAVERLVEPVEGMHRVIAGGWFRRLDPPARPVQVVHDAISTTVYTSIREGAKLAGGVIDATISRERPGVSTSDAVLKGIWGDAVGLDASPEEPSMTIRHGVGKPLDIERDLAAAFPNPIERLVILVHGLADTERVWESTRGAPSLIEAIDSDPDLTAVAIRYNTGLHVSTNGSLLADLLEDLVAALPSAPQSIALVGHSMGGLVIRSAVLAGEDADHRWVDAVSDLITLGTPHQGAPLEKFANAAAWGLRLVPVTAPLGEFLDRRSAGIKDLRFGAVTERDWQGHHPDSLLVDRVVPTPTSSNIRHHFVGGLVNSNPVGRLVGDLMVRASSSSGPLHALGANVVIHEGIHHRQLTRDQRVIDQVMGWLTEPNPPDELH